MYKFRSSILLSLGEGVCEVEDETRFQEFLDACIHEEVDCDDHATVLRVMEGHHALSKFLHAHPTSPFIHKVIEKMTQVFTEVMDSLAVVDSEEVAVERIGTHLTKNLDVPMNIDDSLRLGVANVLLKQMQSTVENLNSLSSGRSLFFLGILKALKEFDGALFPKHRTEFMDVLFSCLTTVERISGATTKEIKESDKSWQYRQRTVMSYEFRTILFSHLAHLLGERDWEVAPEIVARAHRGIQRFVSEDQIRKAISSRVRDPTKDSDHFRDRLSLLMSALNLFFSCGYHNTDVRKNCLQFIRHFMRRPPILSEGGRFVVGLNVFYEGLCKFCVEFGQRIRDCIPELVEALRVFLVHPDSYLVSESQEHFLRDQAIRAVAMLVGADYSNAGDACLSRLLFGLSKVLGGGTSGRSSSFASRSALDSVDSGLATSESWMQVVASGDKGPGVYDVVASNHILLLSGVAVHLKRKSVVEAVMTSLVDHFPYYHHLEPFHSIFCQALVDVARLGFENVFKDVVNILLSLFRSPMELPVRSVSSIPNALLELARGTTTPALREYLLFEVMKHFTLLFTQVSEMVSMDSSIKGTSLVGHIGLLLPVIAELMKGSIDFEKEENGALWRLFRRVWFFLIMYSFVAEGVWLEDWFDAVLNIAKRAPLLVYAMRHSFLETELEIQANFGHVPDADKERVRKELIHYFPHRSTLITRFSLEECLYLLSVFHLERLRASNGTVYECFSYLADETLLLSRHDVYSCLINVIWSVCESFIERVARMPVSEERENLIIKQTELLMLSYCHTVPAVRDVSLSSLIALTRRFPFILFVPSVFETLLELLEEMGQACEQDIVEEWKYHHEHLGLSIYLSESLHDRKTQFVKLVKLCGNWVESASHFCPVSFFAMFHTYLLSFVQNGDKYGHRGCSFLLDHPFAKKAPISKAQDELIVKLRDKANDMHDFVTRSHFLGEFSLFCFDSEATRLGYVKDISEEIFEGLRQFVDTSSSRKESRFRAVMGRATHAFIEDPEFREEYLRDLVWIPVQRFTIETMEVAVKCWSWICSSRPELEVYILEQLIGAWNWTVEEGLGIFDAHNQTPLFCHKKWLEYLYERQIITGERSQEFHNLFASMVTTSLKAAPQMNRTIESLGMRSRLLNIAFQLIHSKVAMNRSLFRRLAFNAAMSWFQNFPAWPTPSCAKHVHEDVQSIIQVCQQLVVERAFLKREVDEVPIGDVFDVRLGEEHEEDRRSVLSGRISHSKSVTTKREPEKSSSVFRLDGERKEAMYVDFSGIIYPRETLSLLLLLYGHELDRIEIYHNPQHNDHQRVVKTTKFTALIQRSKSQWQTHVRTAWAHNPSIAVHLHTRFRNEHVYGEITRLVRDNYSMVPRYPDCIPFLATPDNVAQDFPGLSVLLQCAPTDVLTAFRLLQYPMGNHPHVRRFAVDSLLQSEASELTSFLPQLIQMLQKEKWSARTLEKGGLGHMLYTRACNEEDFAHLLLWCLRTEMENSGICGRMNEEIVRSFSPDKFEFYEKEFKFVDRVTNVSGFLKAIPKPERKKILDSKMREMEMPKGVYLPTHPGLSLTTIIVDKCFPMQSAAKSPILVAFEATKNDVFLRQEKSKEHTVSSEKSDEVAGAQKVAAEVVPCSCIFKMGDDCRQDQLAIQLMSLFKNIFEANRLPLYIYPYRVITTSMGCGLIEVVPNTISRDQLGSRVEGGLDDYFIQKYGHRDGIRCQRAVRCFVESMAAYSIVSYILNVKDRHNGNILLDEDGHILHIDFGFLFDISPGGDFGFESSPFKLTHEMMGVMGMKEKVGKKTEAFNMFINLCVQGFLAVRPHADTFIALVSLMIDSKLPCFKVNSLENLRDRFKLEMNEEEAGRYMIGLVNLAWGHVRTKLYDVFQRVVEGINS